MAQRYGERGVSLVEVALAMLVVSLIMTPLLMIYNAEYKRAKVNKTLGTFNSLQEALNRYINENDRYPMPARLNLNVDSDDFGLQLTTLAGIQDCPTMTDGVCSLVDPVTGHAILIGGVPFASLNVEAGQSLDAWKNKIVYVVTRDQTDAVGFNPDGLREIGLQYYDEATGQRETVTTFDAVSGATVPQLVDALFISMGDAGRGAFNADGVREAACGDPPPLDNQNCSFATTTFLMHQGGDITLRGRYGNSTRAFAEGNDRYYDDLTHPVEYLNRAYWNENANVAENVVTDLAFVGIGQGEPTHTLDVRGDVMVRGNLLTNDICKITYGTDPVTNMPTVETNCFNPVKIYGNEASMICDDMNGVSGVAPSTGIGMLNGDTGVVCASPMNEAGEPIIGQRYDADNFVGGFRMPAAGFTAGGCSGMQRVISINASGGVVCSAL